MAIDVNPTGVFNNYEYTANASSGLPASEGIFIPLTDIPNFVAAEANEALGTADYRKMLWGMLDATYEHIESLDDDDQPTKLTVSRGSLSFIDDDTAQRSYTLTFKYDVPAIEVDDE